jgi:hypothetical protein
VVPALCDERVASLRFLPRGNSIGCASIPDVDAFDPDCRTGHRT